MKRTITVILTMLLLLSSCGGGAVEEITAVETDVQGAVTEETETELSDNLPDRDFGGTTYQILAAVEQWQNKHWAEELTGDQLNDSIYTRDREIEERFNVDLVSEVVNGYSAGMSVVNDKLKGTIQAGDGVYDLSIANVVYASNNIVSGLFCDQMEMEYLDFDAPWYYTDCNTNMTINNTLYASAGYYGINTIGANSGVMFNKQMFDDLGLEYPYQMALDGEWTYDAMLEMAMMAPSDLNGDGVMNNEDRFGFLSTNYETIRFIAYGMGYTASKNDENGIPQLTGASELNVNVTEKLKALMGDKTVFYMADTDPVKEVLPMFANNQGLFVVYPLRIIETEEARDAGDFGILPLPKYNAEQTKYTNPLMPEIAAFPVVIKDAEMSQIVLEALNAASYKDVAPSYYEVILQRKLTRDNDSAAMIDLILDGSMMDAQLAFYFALDVNLYAVDQFLGSSTLTTWWASNQNSLQTKLDNILEFYGVEK